MAFSKASSAFAVAASAGLLGAYAIENGKGITPPMGWRSWNLYGGNVDQSLIMSQMAGMVRRNLTVNGVPTSLADLGYSDVGLDDNWQACGSYGPNSYTYHDANGRPVVNTARFPDFIAMTSYAHSLNLTAGWYGNNCICRDHCSDETCYYGDVEATLLYGFDSIKLDGCGSETDLTMFANLFNASGKPILIENCHWGLTTPNATWCPWNYFRSSGDISASYASMVNNLQTTIQWAMSGLSRPGCWAYPDMLEVGVHLNNGGMTLTESRSHFGAWCVVSSPLILSHDTTDPVLSADIWPIIANTEAIAVNQAWAGFSGSVFVQSNTTVTIPGSLVTVPTWQYWYKPLGNGQTAVLMMNHDSSAASLALQFSSIPGVTCTTCSLRDIWAHQNLGSYTGSWASVIASHDTVFLVVA